MTRDEFNERLRHDGGFRVVVRLLSEKEGGRKTGLSGETEYRANWSVGNRDPEQQAGAPMLIDAPDLSPGRECTASLIRLVPESWPEIDIGTKLTAFEGPRPIAEAVITEVLTPDF